MGIVRPCILPYKLQTAKDMIRPSHINKIDWSSRPVVDDVAMTIFAREFVKSERHRTSQISYERTRPVASEVVHPTRNALTVYAYS